MRNREVVKALQDARAKIADRKHWTRGAFARNERGKGVSEMAPDAVRWCAIGSLWSLNRPAVTEGLVLLLSAAFELFDMDAMQVNDTLGHKAVLRMYDRAIELAGEKP